MKTLASTVNCPYCGKLTDPSLDACPHCGGYIKKKALKASKKNKVQCPSCKGSVDEGDIICVACGTNLLTGQSITDAPRSSESSLVDSIDWEIILKRVLVVCAVVLICFGLYALTNNPVKRAQKLVAKGQYPEAQEILTKCVLKDPENEAAHVELGKLQRRAALYTDAADSFKRALNLNLNNSDAGLLAVLALQESKSPSILSQQIALLELVTEHAENNAQAWYLLGMAYGARGSDGDTAAQISALEQVIVLSPDMESAELGLGIAEMLQGNYTGAEKHLMRVSSPKYQGDVQASLGYIAEYEGNITKSRDYFQEALSSEGINIAIEAQIQLAKVMIQFNDFRPAENHLRELLIVDPSNQLGLYLLGLTIHSQGRTYEALEVYQSLVTANMGYEGIASVQLANIYLLLNDIEGAQRSINVARRAKVNTPAYFTVQGRVYMADDSPAQAHDAYNTAIKMDPEYAPAYMERGLFYVSQSNIEPGVKDLNNYLELIGSDTLGTKARDIRMLTDKLQSTLGS